MSQSTSSQQNNIGVATITELNTKEPLFNNGSLVLSSVIVAIPIFFQHNMFSFF